MMSGLGIEPDRELCLCKPSSYLQYNGDICKNMGKKSISDVQINRFHNNKSKKNSCDDKDKRSLAPWDTSVVNSLNMISNIKKIHFSLPVCIVFLTNVDETVMKSLEYLIFRLKHLIIHLMYSAAKRFLNISFDDTEKLKKFESLNIIKLYFHGTKTLLIYKHLILFFSFILKKFQMLGFCL